MALLEVEGLSAGADGEGVRRVRCAVDEGEVLAVLGAPGSGKTALALALAGALPALEGRIVLDGEVLTALGVEERVQRGLALVPQRAGVLPGLTVAGNLRAGGWTRRQDPGFVQGRLRRCLRYFPRLEARQQDRVEELPPLERVMLGLARALMTGPRLMLVDQPSWGLDVAELEEALAALGPITEGGVAVVVLDRHVAALSPARRAVALRDGVVVYNGPAVDLRRSRALRRDLLWPALGG